LHKAIQERIYPYFVVKIGVRKMADTRRKEYIGAIELAESGHYEQALGQMQSYLKTHPTDGEALNDTGTILFCMNRGQEAIDYFLRARSCSEGDIQTQVVYNLCEAYLAEGQPEKAVTLLEAMDSAQILNVDTINRIANGFVDKLAYGPAIEMLLYSLRLAPEQEILRPMLEIVRSKRIGLMLLADNPQRTEGLQHYLEPRYPLKTCIGSEISAAGICSGNYVSIFAGYSDRIIEACRAGAATIVCLDCEDLETSPIERIPWPQIAALVVPNRQIGQLLHERIALPASLRVLSIAPSADIESIQYIERKKGKRIAAMGPWTAHQNPMFLLHCMQKLHYLDADMRLHLAGEFEDPLVLHYTESMIEAMDLENVVFLDGTPKNLNRWLKDKHYIVSTAIDGRGLSGVVAGMAAGLRPLVHRFPHANEVIDSEYLFVLAEDFCRQILEGSYQPMRYREAAVSRYSPMQVYVPLIRVLSEIEHRVSISSVPPQAAAPAVRPVSRSAPAEVPTAAPTASLRFDPVFSQAAEPVSSPYSGPQAAPSLPEGSIEEVAQRALRAARRLSELSKDVKNHAEPAVQYSEGREVAAPF
jgi:tetratricopeptide (TPR) repeat protein